MDEKEKELRNLTENDYWSEIKNAGDIFTLLQDYYLGEDIDLFRQEKEWIKNNLTAPNGNSRLPEYQRPDILVLLVGFSIEPLLQTIWAYKPQKKIVLILNEQYGYDSSENPNPIRGEQFGQNVKHLIELLYQKHMDGLPCPEIERRPPISEAADVSPVFKMLLELDEIRLSTNLIIDITGGKKRMVAEAFLYAAYTKANISYVDFDDEAYDVASRRPYGFRCQIGLLPNPYEAFAIRDWEEVKKHYNTYNFQAARQALEQLETNLQKAGFNNYFEEAIPKLKAMFECYTLWDSGNFNEAKKRADDIKRAGWNTEFPSAVEILGKDRWWFEVTDTELRNPPSDFYEDTDKFRAYVCDEIERMGRLIGNANYRSAFLRAAGLNEVILVARLARLVTNSTNRQILLDDLVNNTPTGRTMFRALTLPSRTTITISHNQPRQQGNDQVQFYRKHNGRTSPRIQVTLTQSMNRWWQKTSNFNHPNKGWNDFIRIRDKVAHAYFAVTEGLAQDAREFVKANFEDFLDPQDKVSLNSYKKMHNITTSKLDWKSLCQQCGLDKLPPTLLE